MLHRHIVALRTDAPGAEDLAATRERLRDAFPRNATRRMTQLGLLLGGVLHDLAPTENDTVVYASVYGETRALEDYLTSFPTPSPTLFQTSIHPSGIQQVLIARQQPIRHFFPHTGQRHLVAHAVQSALLSPSPRTLLCGGEERGTWLLEHDAASGDTFAFALALSSDSANALGSLRLEQTTAAESALEAELRLPRFFSALAQREPLSHAVAPGLILTLSWN